jgi:hypothetical protein
MVASYCTGRAPVAEAMAAAVLVQLESMNGRSHG